MPSSIRLVGAFETTISIKISGYSRKAVISLEGDESETMDYRRLEVLRKPRTVLEQEWRIEFVPESQSLGTGVHLRKANRRRVAKAERGG
jgi:hypothetical protein